MNCLTPGLLLVAVLACAEATPHPGAAFTPLVDASGETLESAALGVSADSSTVVGWRRTEAGTEAFRWSQPDGMVGLGDLPGDSFYSSANAASADGAVIVGVSRSARGSEAFRWSAQRGMVGLGDLRGGGFLSEARDVSADGKVIVGLSRSGSGIEAFRWTRGSGLRGLGFLGGEFVPSRAEAVSADGSVIVGTSGSRAGTEAFRWTRAGMQALGDLPGGEGPFAVRSLGEEVSADGTVVVGSGSSWGGHELFRWSQKDGMSSLGRLRGGPLDSFWQRLDWDSLRTLSWGRTRRVGFATGVSADGATVVGSTGWAVGRGIERQALIWTAEAGTRALHSLLEELGLDVDGWVLTAAMGVSADGRVIVGAGIGPEGLEQAWLARLP